MFRSRILDWQENLVVLDHWTGLFSSLVINLFIDFPGVVKAAKVKKPDLTAVNELNLNKAMDQLFIFIICCGMEKHAASLLNIE